MFGLVLWLEPKKDKCSALLAMAACDKGCHNEALYHLVTFSGLLNHNYWLLLDHSREP
jgi:hypothetical protein